MDLPIRPLCPQAVLIPGCVRSAAVLLGGLSDVAIAVRGGLQAGDLFAGVKRDQIHAHIYSGGSKKCLTHLLSG